MSGDARPVPGGARRSSPAWLIGNVLVPIGFLALLAFFVWQRRTELASIWEDPDGSLLAIAALAIVSQFLNSVEFWVLYRAAGSRVGLIENWCLFTAGQLGNLVPAQAGAIYKFRYMKAVHGTGYGASSGVYGANVAVSFAAAAAVGLAGVVGAWATGDRFSVIMVLVWVAVAALAATMMFLPAPRGQRLPARVARAWAGFHSAWEGLRTEPGAYAWSIALDVVRLLLTAWRFQIAFGLLGYDNSFWFFAVIAPAAGLSGTIGFSPGAIGFREAFITGAAVAMGTSLDTGLLAATVDRAVLLASSVLLGSIGFAATWPRLRRARREQSELLDADSAS